MIAIVSWSGVLAVLLLMAVILCLVQRAGGRNR